MTSLRRICLPTLCTLALACTDPPSTPDDTGEATSGPGDGDPGDGDPGDGDPGTAGDGDGDPGQPLRPNWHQDVAPLVTGACQGCHTAGGIAPFAMDGYEQTAPWGALMADLAEAGLMPPWHAIETEVCQPPIGFKHDPRLSPDQIQMLRDWAEIGVPEGDPADAAPLPDPPNLELANPTTTVTMASPVQIEAQDQTLDFFHCLSLDPGQGEDVFIDGLQLVEGNSKILHHVLVYMDRNAESAAWPGGVRPDCGGGAGIGGSPELISAWIPGSLPMEPSEGVGIHLPAGARLILNVHYHATGGGPEIDDGTGLALRWTNSVPEYNSTFRLVGQPGLGNSLTAPLMIPAGASDHVEEYEWVVSEGGNPFPDSYDVRLWAIANHMHLVGVDMRVWLEDRDTGQETCLLHTPSWDFSWQRVYEYDASASQGVRVKAGDILHIRCIYDNTLDNQSVVEGLAEIGLSEPIDVNYGEGTLDEMCVAVVGFGVNPP